MIAVTDTGCGIPADIIKQVFEPFFTTKAVGQGTSLSLVYGLVKQSNGHINVYSEFGEGTALRIYLPRTNQREAAKPVVDGGPVRGGNETILIVEDGSKPPRLAASAFWIETARTYQDHAADTGSGDVICPNLARAAAMGPGVVLTTSNRRGRGAPDCAGSCNDHASAASSSRVKARWNSTPDCDRAVQCTLPNIGEHSRSTSSRTR